jgi:glycosyltransferase involved in cell wall biosynthesis
MTADPKGPADRRDGELKGTCALVVPWELHHIGGVNEVVINLHREMLLAGELQPLLVVDKWEAIRPVETVVDGRRTVHLRLWAPWTERGSMLWLLKWLLASPLLVYNWLRLVRRYRIRAINAHFPGLEIFPVALLRLLRLYRGAFILSFHGYDLREARKAGRIGRAFWDMVLRSTTAVVACSRALADEVEDFARGSVHKVHAIRNGLDVERFLRGVNRAAKLPGGLREGGYILSVAAWSSGKGIDNLLRAFAEVRRAIPRVLLVLVGTDEGAGSGLRALAAELKVENDVWFRESVPHAEIGLYLERAKVFCLPSRTEAFGIVILEAGAHSIPVVASRVGGIPEVVIDGESGILVEPDDVPALAAALGRVLSDAKLAGNLGARLHERIVERFSWKHAYRQYRHLYLQPSSRGHSDRG